MPELTSTLDALTPVEKAWVLDELLTAHPDLRGHAEDLAAARLAVQDADAVAEEVASVLSGLDIEELNGRAGYQTAVGYVHEGEAADEILDEALQPFLDDLDRRACHGHLAAATDLAVGILRGLYDCRHAGSETLLEYSPDFPIERAAELTHQCERLGVDLPVDDLPHLIPAWDTLLP